jgi:hypothetical protein
MMRAERAAWGSEIPFNVGERRSIRGPSIAIATELGGIQMSSKYRFVPALALVALVAVIVSASGVEAGETFKGSGSGTFAPVPIDFFQTGCVTVGGITTCTPVAGLGSGSGSASGGPFSGPFTVRDVQQNMPVPGSGCSFLAAGTECTENKSNPNGGCLFTFLPANLDPDEGGVGGAQVYRQNSTGDLFAYYIIGGTFCLDGTTFAYTGTETLTCFGGTGKGADCFGTTNLVDTFSGKIMLLDPAGHGFGWNSDTFTGTTTN